MQRQLVNHESDVRSAVEKLKGKKVLALDTEGYGLRPYHGDTFFSIIIGDLVDSYYFNFLSYTSGSLEQSSLDYLIKHLFSQEFTWRLHNAKYDIAVLRNQGVELLGDIHDTMVTERILDSTLMDRDFSLGATAKRYGLAKDDKVEAYISEHKLYDKKAIPGKKTKATFKYFDKVPMDIMVEYGFVDQEITFKIGEEQIQRLAKIDNDCSAQCLEHTPGDLFRVESQLVRTVSNIENRGVSLDEPFCKRAIDYELSRRTKATNRFREITGETYKNSRKLFERVFSSERSKWVYGEPTKVKRERNPKFDKSVLPIFDNPAAALIMEIHASKALEDQYRGFLYHCDRDGRLHANFNQHIARTGRFSSSQPNLQNVKKDDEESLSGEFCVRRAIVPKPGHFLGMIDFDQVEYRLLLNYCNAQSLIKKIKTEGLDVHGAMAELAGVTRQRAKNVNFATIYGAGLATLAKTIGCGVEEAKLVRDAIGRAAPEIGYFKSTVEQTVRQRGHIFTWLGRKLDYPLRYDRERNEMTRGEFRAVNGLIQGGCADLMKVAMNRIEDFLEDKNTKIVMTIHDELVFEGPIGDEPILLEIRDIMESVYDAPHLKLTAGIDISYKSLADKEAYRE